MQLVWQTAWRGLVRRPALSIVLVVVLTIGLTSAVSVFAVIEALQIRALPFASPAELVHIAVAHESRPLEAEPLFHYDADTLAGRTEVLMRAGWFQTVAVDFSDAGETGPRPDRYDAVAVSADLFGLLGVEPVAGRGVGAADVEPGAPPVVLISHDLWQRRYGGVPVVGRRVRVNREPATIVGVMPERFAFPHNQQVWVPLTRVVPGDQGGTSRVVMVARVTDGLMPAQVQTALVPVLEAARRRQPERYEGYRLQVQPLSWYFVDWQARAGQQLLLFAVMALLLVAVANGAGVWLAHERGREQEWRIRAALGAPGRERASVGLATGALIAVLSTAATLPLSRAALAWLERSVLMSEDPSPYFMQLSIRPLTMLFACGAAALVALVFGVTSAASASRRAGEDGVVGTRVSGSRRAARVAGALVGTQVTLALVVIVAMSVMVGSVQAMGRRDLGVEPTGLLTARIGLPETAYPDAASRRLFWDRLVERVAGETGSAAVTVSEAVPGFSGWAQAVHVDGAARDRGVVRAAATAADWRFVETYRAVLADGRNLQPQDTAETMAVALVDRRFATLAWPGLPPVGRRLRVAEGPWVTVVGLIENVHLPQVDDPPLGTVIVPLAQAAPRFATLAVRVAGDPYAALPTVRRAIGAVDPDLSLYRVYSLPDAIRHGHANVKIFERLLTWLGLCALVLTTVGLYALLAGRVAQRTREIGIRRALGAGAGAIGATVVRQVALPLSMGALAGGLLAWPVSRALVALEPTVLGAGAATWVTAGMSLAVAAALAIAVPLSRALAVDPARSLRQE